MKDWHASTIEVRYIKLCNSLFIHVYYQWFPSGHWHFSVSNNRYEIRSDLSRADPCLVHGFLWGGSPPSNMMLKWSSPTIQYHISWRMWTVSPCEILFSLASVMWNGHSFGPCPKARTFPPPPSFSTGCSGEVSTLDNCCFSFWCEIHQLLAFKPILFSSSSMGKYARRSFQSFSSTNIFSHDFWVYYLLLKY